MLEPGVNIFGETKMSEEIAYPPDITGVVKEATDMPTSGSRAIQDDVIQLTMNIPNYRLGGFYQLKGSTWVDLGKAEDLGFEEGEGEYTLSTSSDGFTRASLKWKDPVGISGCNWVKSEIIIQDAGKIGESVILTSNIKDAYIVTPYQLSLMLEPSSYDGKKFILRGWFENGGYIDAKLTQNT